MDFQLLMSNVRFPQCLICLIVTLVQQIYANLSFEKWPGALSLGWPLWPGKTFRWFSMNVRYTVLQPTVVEGCLGSGKVGECWNQFKVGSDIHLHRRHLLSLFRTYLVTSRQKTCQELPGVKSMKKEEDWLWEHGASRQHVRFMMF